MEDEPTSMSIDDYNLYESLVGTERFIGPDQWLYLTSILSVREFIVLYTGIFDDNGVKIPVVAKATIQYIVNGQIFIAEIEAEAEIHRNTYEYIINHNMEQRIPKYYGVFDDDQYPITYYLMEALGSNLFNLHNISLETVAIDVITALKSLHGAGYFHRDVTPFNIVNTSNDHVALIDFGLSISISEMNPDNHIELGVGNPMFAPMIAFKNGYNYAGDLEGLCYSLEMVYYHNLPWGRNSGRRGYLLRQSFVPTNIKVGRLLDYLKIIGDERPDYEWCINNFILV
jgi:serine/threonine protein kinase